MGGVFTCIENPAGRFSGCSIRRKLSPATRRWLSVLCSGEVEEAVALTVDVSALAPALLRHPAATPVAIRISVKPLVPYRINRFSLISQREHEQLAAPTRPLGDVGQSRSPLANIERKIGRDVPGDEKPHVSTYSCINRDILFSVRASVGHRIPDDA